MDDETEEAIVRITEFLRQWELYNGRDDEIYTICLDPNADMAELSVPDLKRVLLLAQCNAS